jgi:hypothetical protein
VPRTLPRVSTVRDVFAEPGGPVVLKFAPGGFRVSHVGPVAGERIDGGPLIAVATLCAALAFAAAGFAADGAGWARIDRVLAVVAVPFMMAAFFGVGSALVSALAGVRRRIRGGDQRRGAPVWVPAGSVTGASYGQHGDAIVVTVRCGNGSALVYQARGPAGAALRSGFATLLGGRLVAHVGVDACR